MTGLGAIIDGAKDDLSNAMTIGPQAYVCADYARLEGERVWGKVWQQVGRLEEIPGVGDYITYDVHNDSVVIVRVAPDRIRAFHNVCPHRGRQLVDKPEGARNAGGSIRRFWCKFHGWQFNLEGEAVEIPGREEWNGDLTDACAHLSDVKVDSWGGWIWINLDPDAEPLRDYLEPAASSLDPFELEKMRYRWRRWLVLDCNWKVAMEAFSETYHLEATHPQFNKYGMVRGWGRAQGIHSNIGHDSKADTGEEGKTRMRLALGDARLTTPKMLEETLAGVDSITTETMIAAARRLVDELPEGTPPDVVMKHWMDSARADDAARGVVWPTVDPQHWGESGLAWQIFPNLQVGHGIMNAFCLSARPYGADPDKCLFEVIALELYPQGGEPETEWTHIPLEDPRWLSVLPQDFSNMAAIQRGMKSSGFRGTQPNPYRERAVVQLHRSLAKYMDRGAPRRINS